jgi:sulfatase maturation enzyme AslB (radical SAM superfamily)
VSLIITTNGLRITSEVAHALRKIGPLEVRVSFEGSLTLHEHVRGSGTYAKSDEGIGWSKRGYAPPRG